jgi:hypothetical protein
MSLRFLLDEQLRGRLWHVIERHNRVGACPLDVVCVGDPADLPTGTPDPEIVLWAEREGRILVSEDWSTMLTHFQARLAAGHRSPGLFLLRPLASLVDVVDFLAAAAYASDEREWVDVWRYIP